jgi:hypothetical protein
MVGHPVQQGTCLKEPSDLYDRTELETSSGNEYNLY